MVCEGSSVGKRKLGIGFGLSLVAETSTGTRFAADVVAPPAGGIAPEDVGRNCALQLVETAGPAAGPFVLLVVVVVALMLPPPRVPSRR